jgi:hypothetical protein
MSMIPLDSSAIAAAGYDGRNLYIWFQSGPKIYEFPNVPYSVFMGLIESSSPGTYYHLNIHDRFK